MRRFATATVGALGAVHAGFDGEENAGVDGLLDLSCEEDESVEIVLTPVRVELMMCRSFRFREDIEPEHRHPTVELTIGWNTPYQPGLSSNRMH